MILGRHCATPRADMACRRRATAALAGWMRARAVRASSVTVAEGVTEGVAQIAEELFAQIYTEQENYLLEIG